MFLTLREFYAKNLKLFSKKNQFLCCATSYGHLYLHFYHLDISLPQEVEKKIKELQTTSDELKKEIGQRQNEVKNLKEDLDQKHHQYQTDRKDFEADVEEMEKLKVLFFSFLKLSYINNIFEYRCLEGYPEFQEEIMVE